MFNWGTADAKSIREDVFDLIRIFYDALGGARLYSKHPPQVKQICCGLERSLIASKFRTAGDLRSHLETMDWEDH